MVVVGYDLTVSHLNQHCHHQESLPRVASQLQDCMPCEAMKRHSMAWDSSSAPIVAHTPGETSSWRPNPFSLRHWLMGLGNGGGVSVIDYLAFVNLGVLFNGFDGSGIPGYHTTGFQFPDSCP